MYREAVEAYFRSLFEPKQVQGIKEWCEGNLTLSPKVTSRPGPYSTNGYEYVHGIFDVLGDSAIQTVVLCFGAQSAKTLTLSAWLAYRVANDPAPAVFVMPNEKLARSFSETRLQPLFDECEPVAWVKPVNSDRYKLLEMHFDSMTLNLIGSNSPSNLASRPVEIAILDELDKFKEPTSKEASAFNLALERTKTFPRRKHVLTSTPTIETGDIWEQFLLGDQRYYHIPCPHCGDSIRFQFENLKWDEKARGSEGWDFSKVNHSTFYECPACKGQIRDQHKPAMIRAGEWRAHNESPKPAQASFHLNSLYSPDVTFGQVAIKFIEEKRYLNGLQNFVNSWLAEPWKDQFSDSTATLPRGDFYKKQSWGEEAIRLMAVDKQIDHYWFVCRAWSSNGKSQLIDEGRRALWEDIRETQQELNVASQYTVIDAGYETQEVYSYCHLYGWVAMMGEERKSYTHDTGIKRRLYSPAQSRIVYGPRRGSTSRAPKGSPRVKLILFSSQTAQDLLDWQRRSGDWKIASDVSEEYLAQIESHKKRHTLNPKTGLSDYKWVRIGRSHDHLYDCETMLIAFAAYGKLVESPDSPTDER